MTKLKPGDQLLITIKNMNLVPKSWSWRFPPQQCPEIQKILEDGKVVVFLAGYPTSYIIPQNIAEVMREDYLKRSVKHG